MNTDERLDRLLQDVLDAGTPSRPPARLEPETLRAIRKTYRRPRWLAFIKEPPMRMSSGIAVGSPMARVAVVMVATLLLAIMVAGAGIAGSRLLAAEGPIIVDASGAGHYTTIAEAVGVAEDGDTILVKPGLYTEGIAVTKDITIEGDGERDEIVVEAHQDRALHPACSDADPFASRGGCAFVLDQTNATIAGLTMRGDWAGIHIIGGEPTVRDVRFEEVGAPFESDLEGDGNPMTLAGATRAHILKSEFIDSSGLGIFEDSSPIIDDNDFHGGTQIWANNVGDDLVIRDNRFSGTFVHTILLDEPSTSLIEGNTISGAGTDAIVVGWTAAEGIDPVIRDNTITDSGNAAIRVSHGSGATIEANSISGNQTGILIGRGEARVVDNVLTDNQAGVAVNGGSPTMEGNTITGGGSGLVIAGAVAAPILSGNTICDNTVNVSVGENTEVPPLDDNEICEDALQADE